MASASPICFMARATSTKSRLWHQLLSHLNFDTINDLAKNDLVTNLLKFKYHKEHLCPSCEQGKSKNASHPPKHVPNSKQRLHLIHMDLGGPMGVKSINGKRYILVIVDVTCGFTFSDQRMKNPNYPKNDHEDIRKLGAKGLDLTYAPSTITSQKPTERELDPLFEAMYDDYIGGQPSAAPRIAPANQNLQTLNASITVEEYAPTPTNSSL
nr:ribonuclease H-like domain-containing protein [Tanacetum cinerariifolium]